MSSTRVKPHHYLAYGGYRAFEVILKLFPMEVVCLIGGLLGNITWLLMPGRKRTVIRNLRIAFGDEMSAKEIHQLCRKCFQTTGSNMIASIRAVFLSDVEIARRMFIEGKEHVQPMLDEGEGFIGLLAHMGNWEMMAQVQRADTSLPAYGGMYRPLDNPLMDRLVKRRRQNSGAKLFSRRDGFFKPTAYLKAGNPMGIFADQHAGKHGVAVPFFGKMTSMTNLPSILHIRAKSKVIPASISTVGLGKWKLKLHPPSVLPPGIELDTKSFVLATVASYENLMRDSPQDVLWMHNYWRIGQKQPFVVDGAKRAPLRPIGTGTTKPLRILIHAPEECVSDDSLHWVIANIKSPRIDVHLTLLRDSSPVDGCAHHICLPDKNDPPHVLGHAVSKYLNSQIEPLDFALDLTPRATAADVLQGAKVAPIFTLTGKYQASSTRKAFGKGCSEMEICKMNERERLTTFLSSLGLNIEPKD